MNSIILDEQEIKNTVIETLRTKIADRYSYPLMDEIIKEVMQEEDSRNNLKRFIRECLLFVKGDAKFEKIVKEEFQRKVAKSMIGKLEGTVERAVDAIRQDQTLRAEMILAIEKIVSKK